MALRNAIRCTDCQDCVALQRRLWQLKEMQSFRDAGRSFPGTFFSLGSDVHCLFYKPAGVELSTPDPVECFQVGVPWRCTIGHW